LRLGTPILTTRGMGESEMKMIGEWISAIIKNPKDISLQKDINSKVRKLCEMFRFY